MNELEAFRKEKDHFFATSPQSPLRREQKRDFHGLSYFSENPDLRFELTLDAFEDKDTIQVQTSTGSVQTYIRYGRFNFLVDGQEADLVLYYNDNGFFLPFVDSLAGKETYGAGRYLEPEPLDERQVPGGL